MSLQFWAEKGEEWSSLGAGDRDSLPDPRECAGLVDYYGQLAQAGAATYWEEGEEGEEGGELAGEVIHVFLVEPLEAKVFREELLEGGEGGQVAGAVALVEDPESEEGWRRVRVPKVPRYLGTVQVLEVPRGTSRK